MTGLGMNRAGMATNGALTRSALPAYLGYCLALVLVVACTSEDSPTAAGQATSSERSSSAPGYVLTSFTFELPGAQSGECPDGFNRTMREYLIEGLPPAEHAKFEAAPREYLKEAAPLYHSDPALDPCANPAAFDTGEFLTIDGPVELTRVRADGTVVKLVSNRPDTCPGEAFSGDLAERPIDNQFWRAVGCVKGYQPGGQIDDFAEVNIKNGSRTILLKVMEMGGNAATGDVRVGIYSSEDAIPAGANGELLPGASLEVVDNPRYHNVAPGHLNDGVLTAGPFDLRLQLTGQRIDSEYFFRDARLRLELHPDGTASGFLGGYYDVEQLAHGFIRYQDETGRSSGGAAADTLGYTCPALYSALKSLANGHPDSETGECTSISTVFRLRAIPAFVLGP